MLTHHHRHQLYHTLDLGSVRQKSNYKRSKNWCWNKRCLWMMQHSYNFAMEWLLVVGYIFYHWQFDVVFWVTCLRVVREQQCDSFSTCSHLMLLQNYVVACSLCNYTSSYCSSVPGLAASRNDELQLVETFYFLYCCLNATLCFYIMYFDTSIQELISKHLSISQIILLSLLYVIQDLKYCEFSWIISYFPPHFFCVVVNFDRSCEEYSTGTIWSSIFDFHFVWSPILIYKQSVENEGVNWTWYFKLVSEGLPQ